MPDFYRVRIQSIHDKNLTCRVTELYGDDIIIEPSLTLAFGFLWDTVVEWGVCPDAQSSPLGRELAGRDFCDQDWSLENAERFISCFGVVDRRVVIVGEDGRSSHRPEGTETTQATYNIAVTEPRWLEHLTPGLEWESRVFHQGWELDCDPAWRTSDVLALARGIDADLAFDRMPILADALQEAGCTKAYILNHCRDPHATHVRGCWVVDLILGKE
jgi:hypothetical protein